MYLFKEDLWQKTKGTSLRQVPVPIEYKGIRFDEGFHADLIVEEKVNLELKCVEHVAPSHKKQVQAYLRLTGCKMGYLLNFGEEVLRTGIPRCVNGLEEKPLCASAPLWETRPEFHT